MRRKRRIYVLWYQPEGDGGVGWPTMSPTEEKLPNVFQLRSEAIEALKDHNKRWPEDKKEMSIEIFEEVSR